MILLSFALWAFSFCMLLTPQPPTHSFNFILYYLHGWLGIQRIIFLSIPHPLFFFFFFLFYVQRPFQLPHTWFPCSELEARKVVSELPSSESEGEETHKNFGPEIEPLALLDFRVKRHISELNCERHLRWIGRAQQSWIIGFIAAAFLLLHYRHWLQAWSIQWILHTNTATATTA